MRNTLALCILAVALWTCGSPTPPPVPPTPTAIAQATIDCAPAWTRIVAAEATLSEVETLVALVIPTCGALWDCCANATLAAETPQATCAPLPTYTPYPTATEAPVLCRRCIANQPMPYNCPVGFFCRDCAVGKSLCVRVASPGADCNYCLSLVIP